MFYWSFILQVFKSTIDIGKDVYTSGTLSTNIGYKFTTLCDVVSDCILMSTVTMKELHRQPDCIG